MDSTREITELLQAWQRGDASALERLMPLVMSELRDLAKSYMRKEKQGHTLQTTALINEAYIKLVEQKRVDWQNRSHFFGVAALCMRRILVDHAKAQGRNKRGGSVEHIALSDDKIIPAEKSAELIALDEALQKLSQQDERKSKVVELKYFGGLNMEEIAEVLNVSKTTVEREWRMARAWLQRELSTVVKQE